MDLDEYGIELLRLVREAVKGDAALSDAMDKLADEHGYQVQISIDLEIAIVSPLECEEKACEAAGPIQFTAKDGDFLKAMRISET